MNVQIPTPATTDLATIKDRQHAAWGSGDYARIGTTLQIVGETLCEQRALDVAAGNGNATLAAARRFADVVSTDYVGSLLERGRERAEANRLPVTFQQADAEDLPFADGSFDVVLSTFGVMFTPNQEKAASELIRVCRPPAGKIGLAN
jgi:ubiquinone/menaquinone biosynthesis C-methylase UbiE